MQQPVPVLNFKDFISAQGEAITTTSLQIATAFGRRHADVIRAINNLECSKEFTQRNFALSGFTDSTGRELPYYRVTYDGFAFLCMGFTGKGAAQWKEAYINAFNAMAAFIKNQREGLQYQYLAKELEYKTRRSKVSACAREMRHWRDDKPLIEDRLSTLLVQMQPDLLAVH